MAGGSGAKKKAGGAKAKAKANERHQRMELSMAGAAVAPPRGAAALTAAEGRIEIERSMTVALCE